MCVLNSLTAAGMRDLPPLSFLQHVCTKTGRLKFAAYRLLNVSSHSGHPSHLHFGVHNMHSECEILSHLELAAVHSRYLRLLSDAERVDVGADGSLHGEGEEFVILLNHDHRLHVFPHFDDHFWSSLKVQRI